MGVEKRPEEFRDYADPSKREFYRVHHEHQTLGVARTCADSIFSTLRPRLSMGIWEALERLDSVTDDSDPDTALPQSQHALQSAEAIRGEDLPDWFVLTGLLHDLGKVLLLMDEPQWAVVGDTYPLGCAYSPKIVCAEFLPKNPFDKFGLYREGCGLDNVTFTWGHDEYLFRVLAGSESCSLPSNALRIIRYHSAYVIHQAREYDYLLDNNDRALLPWLQLFSEFDLYSKAAAPVDKDKVRPYYEDLIARYVPGTLLW